MFTVMQKSKLYLQSKCDFLLRQIFGPRFQIHVTYMCSETGLNFNFVIICQSHEAPALEDPRPLPNLPSQPHPRPHPRPLPILPSQPQSRPRSRPLPSLPSQPQPRPLPSLPSHPHPRPRPSFEELGGAKKPQNIQSETSATKSSTVATTSTLSPSKKARIVSQYYVGKSLVYA